MAKKGRKNKYETHIKPYFAEIHKMLQDMTEQQVAKKLGISYSGSWCRYKNDYPEFAELIQKSRQDLVSDLRSTIIKRAKGYTYTEKKTTTQMVKYPKELYKELLEAGFKAYELEMAMTVKTEVSQKHMAPDIAALNLTLKNYDPENWANDPQMLAIRKEELEIRKKQVEQNDW